MSACDDGLGALRAIVGDAHVLVDDLDRFERDWRGRYRGSTLAAIRPRTSAEVADIVRACRTAGIAIVPQGGNTGMSGGAVPPTGVRNVILCLDRLNRIRAVDPVGGTMTAEAGCTLAAIQDAAADAGRLFPLALGSQGSCQIGGNVSTNAGGTAVLRYGNMRDLVLGLEVVLPDGRVWDGLRSLRKDNTGYDIKQLFIGAEGTLGIVTAVVLKLFAATEARAAAWIAVPDLDRAIALLGHLQACCGDRLSTFEVMSRGQLDLVLRNVPGTRDPLPGKHPWTVLAETTDGRNGTEMQGRLEAALAEMLEAGLIQDAAVAATEAQAKDFWRLRDSVSEANRNSGLSVSHDTSVPIPMIPAFVARATAALTSRPSAPQVVAVGHVGDGNIHLVAIFDRAGWDPAALLAEADAASAEVHRIAAELGGSISAEHGIGSAKRDELILYKSPVEMEMMRAIKRLFDPDGLMNPGKVVAPDPGA